MDLAEPFTDDHMAIDSNDKVKPRLDGQLGARVPQDLESIRVVIRTSRRGMRRRVGVKASNEAV
jgi:hypothetical protein